MSCLLIYTAWMMMNLTNEIDLLQLTIREYQRSHRILKMNEELLLYLTSNVKHIFRYADKHSIPLKNRDRLHEMSEKANSMIGEMDKEASKSELGIFDDNFDPTKFDSENFRRRLYRTD